MKILHLCSYYTTSKLYSELVESLSDLEVDQRLFIPIRKPCQRDLFRGEKTKKIKYVYVRCMFRVLRLSYFGKMFSYLTGALWHSEELDLKHREHVYCHTLFSDGGLGLFLKVIYRKSYSITVRNTDINLYLKYFPHLRLLAYFILKHASHVIFISPAYKEYCLKRHPFVFSQSRKKQMVIPNGVHPFWISNMKRTKEKKATEPCLTILFVGKIVRNKNIHGLIAACELLERNKRKVCLKIVGGNDDDLQSYKPRLRSNSGISIVVSGTISDKIKLASIMNSADVLVVPSFTETFGLVYVEALTQGTPVVFSEGQGLSGYFPSEFTCVNTCNPHDPKSIAAAIISSISSPPSARQQEYLTSKFDWDSISRRILKNISVA